MATLMVRWEASQGKDKSGQDFSKNGGKECSEINSTVKTSLTTFLVVKSYVPNYSTEGAMNPKSIEGALNPMLGIKAQYFCTSYQ